MQNFSLFIKNILEQKGMTVYSLSKKVGISSSQLYRVIDGNSEPSPYVLWEISKVLGISLDIYYRTFYNFKTVEEYRFLIRCRELIEGHFDINKLEDLQQEINKYECSESDFMFNELKYYLNALVLNIKNKNYKKSNEICFRALGINSVFSVKNIRGKYLKSEFSYNIVHLIEANYFYLDDIEMSMVICNEVIDEIETMYYNENIPKFYIPTTIFKTYVAMINNKADILFKLGNCLESIELCNHGIKVLNENNSMYLMSQLLELKFQNYYMLGDMGKAKDNLKKARVVCEVCNNFSHLERINKRVESDYGKVSC